MADYLIQEAAIDKITENSIILTFAKCVHVWNVVLDSVLMAVSCYRSSVVEQVILRASQAGKKFTVCVIDSGPLFEGKPIYHCSDLDESVTFFQGRRLLDSLKERGITCSYSHLSALGTVIANANLVLLGAHSLYANGALYSRAGTALVATMASQRSIPVLACCETYKFSNDVPFDGFTKNELGNVCSFVFPVLWVWLTCPVAVAHSPELRPCLQTLNPLYDLTPANMITAVITEIGLIPPSSVPTVLPRAGIQE